MRTTSGAHVHLAGPLAVKWGSGPVGSRVGAQAVYMRDLGPAVTGRVHASGRNWLVMERLSPLPLGSECIYVLAALEALCGVWRSPPPFTTPLELHERMMVERARVDAPHLAAPIRRLFPRVPWRESVMMGSAHGDPTLENTMVDPPKSDGRKARIIDPLPPYLDGSVPQTPAVDVGKIIQSLLGYERAKTGRPSFTDEGEGVGLGTLVAHLPAPVVAAGAYFAVVHFTRLMRYQPSELRDAMTELSFGAVELAEDALS